MLLIAARQRLNALWPLLSLAILAVLAATSQVQANREAIPSGLGHISVDFAIRPAAQNEYALVVFLLAIAPYVLWKLQTHRTYSA